MLSHREGIGMEIGVTREEGTVLVELRGRISAEEVDGMVKLLEGLPEKGDLCFTIRFGGVSYLQPPILNALCALLRRLPDRGTLELVVEEAKLANLLRRVGLAGRRKVTLLEEPAPVVAG